MRAFSACRAGVPRAKMVAGVAMYGRGFSGVERDAAGLLSKRGGFPGADGSLVYREIAARYLGPKGQGLRGFRAEFDARTQAWNLVHPKLKLWIGYDDPRAVRAKGQYVLKNGLAGLTKVTALEGAKHGVRCNLICPGYVHTPLVDGQIADTAKARGMTREQVIEDVILEAQPTREFVTVEQIAGFAAFLCSPDADQINGAELSIDGGWTAE